MRARLRKALLEARRRSISRELENLDVLRARSEPAPFERADDTHVLAAIREHEGDLLRDLNRLSELMREQGAN